MAKKKLDRTNLPAAPGQMPTQGDGLPRYTARFTRDGLRFSGPSGADLLTVALVPIALRVAWRSYTEHRDGQTTISQAPAYSDAGLNPSMAVQVLGYEVGEAGERQLVVLHANGYAAGDLGAIVARLDREEPARYCVSMTVGGADTQRAVGKGSYYPLVLVGTRAVSDMTLDAVLDEMATKNPERWAAGWNEPRSWSRR